MDAVDDLGDALDATRNFLTPVRAGLWLRLAVVVLFVSGLTVGGPPVPGADLGPIGGEPITEPETGAVPDGPETEIHLEDVLPVLAVIGGVLALLWLGFAFVGAITEFVLIESLRSSDVRVRRYARENVGRGARLFGFRVLLGLGMLLIVGAPVAMALLGTNGVAAGAGVGALAALFGIGVYAIYAVVMRFTSEFVAPVMLLENRGIVGAWRRFWGTLRSNWTEYGVYLLLVWVIRAAVGIAVNLLLVVGAIIVAIPVVVLAAALSVLGTPGIVLAIPVVLAGVLAVLLFAAVVRVPVLTYFKYYALLVLGDTNGELDLIPDQRAAIRADGGAAASGLDGDESPRVDDRRRGNGRGAGADDRSSEDRWSAENDIDDWEDAGWDERDERDRDDRGENDDRGW